MKTDFLEFAIEKLYVGGSLNPLRERGSRYMPVRYLKTERFVWIVLWHRPSLGYYFSGRRSPLQGEGQQFKSAILHQPTGRRNLLKEETDFRHETNTRTEPPGIVRGSIAHGVKVSKCQVSLPPGACGSIVTQYQIFIGERMKAVRTASNLGQVGDTLLMSLFGLCFLGKTKHHKYRRASYSHRISQVWRETKGCVRRRPVYLKLQIQVLKVYRVYSKARRVGYKRGQRIAV